MECVPITVASYITLFSAPHLPGHGHVAPIMYSTEYTIIIARLQRSKSARDQTAYKLRPPSLDSKVLLIDLQLVEGHLN